MSEVAEVNGADIYVFSMVRCLHLPAYTELQGIAFYTSLTFNLTACFEFLMACRHI